MKHHRKGFTMVEILLYLVIVAMIVGVISSFFYLMYSIDTKSKVSTEVEYQGDLAMENILDTIRNSEDITLPTISTNGSTLTLDVVEPLNDPTIYTLASGRIGITEGSQPLEYLTSDRVNVSNIQFSNVSYADTPGAVRVEFTINYINNIGRNEYTYEKTFYGTASLR